MQRHSNDKDIMIWVCLKMGYMSNYSHFIGIMIIQQWVQWGTLFSDTPTSILLVFWLMSTLAQPQPRFAIYHHMAGAQEPVVDAHLKDISGVISETSVKVGPASRDSVIGTSRVMIP